MQRLANIVACVLAAGALAGCASSALEKVAQPSEGLFPPTHNPVTKINAQIRALPPPERKVAVAVYGYADQTGKFAQPENVQSLSRAVTQGATSVLIKALQDAGEGSWFLVVEREKLDNLLKERRIIADMRERYLGEKNLNPQALPPLLFAGVLLEGGIIGFDSNTKTGGAGARYLGIGGDVQYREDTVTVYLRAISTKSGEVMSSVVAHKTIVSFGVKGGAFKFVAIDKILEAEAGFTRNEPEQLAVQQAIEKAVHTMIVDGAARGLWAFTDKVYQNAAISKLDYEQDVTRQAKAQPAKEDTAVASNGTAPNRTAPQSQPSAPNAVAANPPASVAAQQPKQAPQQQPKASLPPGVSITPPVVTSAIPPNGAAVRPASGPQQAGPLQQPDTRVAWRVEIKERELTESERLSGRGAQVRE